MAEAIVLSLTETGDRVLSSTSSNSYSYSSVELPVSAFWFNGCVTLSQSTAANVHSHINVLARYFLSVKAKFHYAVWSQTASKQVRSWSQTCSKLKFGLSSSLLAANYHELAGPSWPASNLSATSFEIAWTCSKLVADRFEAKFHYAIWFEAGSKLVADRSATIFGPVCD